MGAVGRLSPLLFNCFAVPICQRRFDFVVFRRLKNAGKQWCGNVEKLGLSLFKEGIDNVPLLLHIFFTFFQPIAPALDIDDGTVVQNTVEDRRGDGDIGKDLVPLRKGLVGSEDCWDLLIPSGNELKEQVRTLNIHWKIPGFVDDEQLVFAQSFELIRQTVFKMRLFELLNQCVAVDVVSGKAMPGSDHSKR